MALSLHAEVIESKGFRPLKKLDDAIARLSLSLLSKMWKWAMTSQRLWKLITSIAEQVDSTATRQHQPYAYNTLQEWLYAPHRNVPNGRIAILPGPSLSDASLKELEEKFLSKSTSTGSVILPYEDGPGPSGETR